MLIHTRVYTTSSSVMYHRKNYLCVVNNKNPPPPHTHSSSYLISLAASLLIYAYFPKFLENDKVKTSIHIQGKIYYTTSDKVKTSATNKVKSSQGKIFHAARRIRQGKNFHKQGKKCHLRCMFYVIPPDSSQESESVEFS